MEVTGADITFSLQHGLVRDITTVSAAQLTLKTLKDRACEFINTKVSTPDVPSLSPNLIFFSLFMCALFFRH